MSEKVTNITPAGDPPTIIAPDALDAAEKEAAESSDIYTHTLSKPFTYEGKTYTEMRFDFDSVNGYGCIAIEQELRSQGIAVPVREFSCEYQVRFAARACTEKIASDVLMALPARDFNRICNQVRSFLLRSGS